ncbi:rab-GTPase-TBC domain-containing protein [Halteromyces radiatus]|uniref:rab-GTPase-TBC domain-containing protein n=1 Tax=Halteromyces radiatus TaxID=101107 RepID=UPI00221E9F37|nr:rab-GTPase-TBC domain-containing protein [Halteromyces radiatus]KAI8099001.1 rab-GTPase-TBC domain-containing protein [Halteromyces radiatus]
MTILQSRRQAWDVIFSDPNLSQQSLQQRGISGTVCEHGLRSVCWKIYMGYLPSVDVSTWPTLQMKERQRYTDLRRQYIEEPAERMTKKNDNLTDNNPLALNENNPWQQYFADSEIRKIIRQDVDRTFPDVEFFRNETVQEKMTDILFIYCKIHHEVSYRQGMHELLAPFYWNIATESLDGVSTEDIDACLSDPTNRLMTQVLDPAFIEHDAFLLFDRLMSYAKPWYEFNNTTTPAPAKSLNRRSKSALDLTVDHHGDSGKAQMATSLNPVVGVCQRIHHQYLRQVDPPLYKHLESFGIEPQLFGIRWLRLLFGREFEFHELLRLWDAIFAQDPTLKIVEFVCVALLLRLHDQLIENDYAECLTLLMRGTRISNPITLVEQAKYLHGNLSHDGALQVLRQNDLRAGKEPRASLWKNDLENAALPQQHLSSYPRRSQVSNLDNITNITRGVMKSPQVRDLNKTIAGVMGTVHKNVNLFGDNVLGRGSFDGQTQRRRLTVPSEFPDSIDRIAPMAQSYKHSSTLPRSSSSNNIQRTSSDHTTSTGLATLQKVNRQMGDMMARCIDVLEKEIFSAETSPSIQRNDTTPIDLDTTTFKENKEDTTTTISQEQHQIDEKNLPVVTQGKQGLDEASVTLALAGLKHIRDVLQGRQSRFDSNMLSGLELSKDSNNNNNSLLSKAEQRDIIKKPLPDIQQKPLHHPTSAESVETGKTPAIQTPSPTRPITVNDTIKHIPSTTTSATSSTPTKVTYSIEDLLSDPALQSGGIDSQDTNKFSWLDNDDKPTSDQPPSLFQKTEVSHDQQRRRRPSYGLTTTTDLHHVDPLDAKNVDKHYDYEYDIYR